MVADLAGKHRTTHVRDPADRRPSTRRLADRVSTTHMVTCPCELA